jgi:hypothetical protein
VLRLRMRRALLPRRIYEILLTKRGNIAFPSLQETRSAQRYDNHLVRIPAVLLDFSFFIHVFLMNIGTAS